MVISFRGVFPPHPANQTQPGLHGPPASTRQRRTGRASRILPMCSLIHLCTSTLDLLGQQTQNSGLLTSSWFFFMKNSSSLRLSRSPFSITMICSWSDFAFLSATQSLSTDWQRAASASHLRTHTCTQTLLVSCNGMAMKLCKMDVHSSMILQRLVTL